MTEIVSSPRRARSSVNRVAAATSQDLDLQSVGVELGERGPDLAQQLARRGAGVSSSQNTAGRARSRARASTASRTQSRIGGVLGLAHPPDVARLDVVLEQRLAVARRRRGRCPRRRSRRSCRASRTPRPPGPSGRRSASCPSSPGRTRRARGSARRSRRRAARRSGRGSRTWCPAARRRRSTSDPRCGSRPASRRR